MYTNNYYRVLALGILIGLAPASSAKAVSQAGGIIDAFPYSARSTALGSSFALSDGGPFAVHLNPAALARRQPMSIGYTVQELIPELAVDVDIKAYGATFQRGAFGFGASYAKLSLGEQRATGSNNEDLGTFNPFQTSVQAGVAASVLEIGGAGTVADDGRSPMALLVGANVKRIHDELAPSDDASATTIDIGLQFRRTRRVGAGEDAGSYLGLRLASVVDNVLDSTLEFEDQGWSDPLQSWFRYGVAIEGEFLPVETVGHMLKFVLFYERAASLVENDDSEIQSMGIELVAGNALSFRFGQYDDPEGDVQAPTVGIGVGLEWLGLPAGARFDYASRPQASGLGRVHNVGVTLSSWGVSSWGG